VPGRFSTEFRVIAERLPYRTVRLDFQLLQGRVNDPNTLAIQKHPLKTGPRLRAARGVDMVPTWRGRAFGEWRRYPAQTSKELGAGRVLAPFVVATSSEVPSTPLARRRRADPLRFWCQEGPW